MEDLGNGVLREWLIPNRIVIHHVSTKGQDIQKTLATWDASMTQQVTQWDGGVPLRGVQDMRESVFSFGFLPIVQSHVPDMKRGVVERIAVVLPDNGMTELIKRTLNPYMQQYGGNSVVRFFMDYDEALVWIQEDL